MSDVVEKTLSAFPSLLSLDPQPASSKLSPSSKLGHLVRSITELTSKHEEEKLITKELAAIKDQISSPNTTMRQMRELMVRAMYCEMLGYEASFVYIHAIKLAQQGSVLEKRVGYLAVSLFLSENHELLVLLVNTVLKDLQSTNLLEVCMALTVVSQIFPKDMIPSVLPLIEEKLSHQKEIIRQKAVLALYKFYLIAPNQVQHIHGKFRKALCDKDPGVMTSSLHIYLQLIKEKPDSYKDLTGSFVTILRQVVAGKLPLDFNYHTVPAPWLQMQLLQILSLLGKEDQSTSELMYDVLEESLRRAEINHNITYAILFECVKAIYTIYPKAELLEKAARCIGNFVLSSKINLKYIGLKALTYVVQYDANLALQHQMTIIDCLDHSDLIIKRETLELLYRITNAHNVSVIVEKMLGFLQSCSDEYTIIDLVGKVAELVEKYAPDNEWFIQTMNAVFSIGGDLMQPDIASNFLRLLEDGSSSEEEDRQLKRYAVDSYLTVLRGDCSRLPQCFLQVIVWVLGEYSYMKEGLDQCEVIKLLKKVLETCEVTSETRSWVLSALTKLCQGSEMFALELAGTFSSSLDTVLRQQAHELLCLIQDSQLHSLVLPRPSAMNSIEVDCSLSFLDGFVSDALAAGAAPYKPPHQRQEELRQQTASLTLKPYGELLSPSLQCATLPERPSSPTLSVGSALSYNSNEAAHRTNTNTLLLDGVKRVWGKEGYLPQKKPSESPAVEQEPGGVRESLQQNEALQSSQPPPEPEPSHLDQDKQQLASSLFVGLDSQKSMFGKSEAAPRFRRKHQQHESASSSLSSGTSSNSSQSHHSRTDNVFDAPATLLKNSNGSHDVTRHSQSTNSMRDTEPVAACERDRSQILLGDTVPIRSDVHPDESSVLTHKTSKPPPSSLSSAPVLTLPAELQDLQHSDFISLTADPHLSVSCCHVFRDDALLFILFLCNLTELPLHDVTVELSCEGVEITSLKGNVLESLDSRSSSVCRYTLLMKMPHTQVTFRGVVSYQTHPGLSHTLSFYGKLATADFIRPLVLSTEEYGKLWLSFCNDVKHNLKMLTDVQDPLSSTLNALQDSLHLHIVDIIGTESILACRLLCGAPCLMHCCVTGATLAVWLRSPLPFFPECLLFNCQKVLEQH